MRTFGSTAAVVVAIREDAVAEIERLERAAITAPQSEPPAAPADDDPRVAAARARARDLELERQWSAALADLQERERWMDAVAELGRGRLRDDPDRERVRAWMRALVTEAAASLPPGPCAIVVPAAVAPWLDDSWSAPLAADLGRTLSIEAGAIGAGCVVQLVDRPLAYDNSLEARERRSEGEWRAALARVYADAIARAVEEPVAAAATAAGP